MYVTREHYRKNLKTPGRIAIHGEMIKFDTVDISVGGAKIHLELLPEIAEPMAVRLFLDDFKTQGDATTVWSEPDEDGGCYVGLKFDQMQGEVSSLNVC